MFGEWRVSYRPVRVPEEEEEEEAEAAEAGRGGRLGEGGMLSSSAYR